MPLSLEFIAPRLDFDSSLLEIKTAVLEARKHPQQLEIDDDALSHFAPRLEGNWGSLYEALPAFFDELLTGTWTGSDIQGVPSSLVGDFGEFVAGLAFQQENPNSRIARVLRPADVVRPDFLAWDATKKHLVALEVKSRAECAANSIHQIRDGKLLMTLCGGLRDKRDLGKLQVGADAVVLKRAPSSPVVVERPTVDYRYSRVVANRSAVATPLFLDGRLKELTIDAASRKPHGCGHSCLSCLWTKSSRFMMMIPFFYNTSTRFSPLSPDGIQSNSFFDAYQAAGEAIWARSEKRFHAAWIQLVKQTVGGRDFRRQAPNYIVSLLDIWGAAAEQGISPAEQFAFSEIDAAVDGIPGAMEEAVALHRADADATTRDSTPAGQPIPSKAPARQFNPEELQLESWANRYAGKRRDGKRTQTAPIYLEDQVNWRELRRRFGENINDEQLFDLVLNDGRVVQAARPRISNRRSLELRLVSEEQSITIRAGAGILRCADPEKATWQAIERGAEELPGRDKARSGDRTLGRIREAMVRVGGETVTLSVAEDGYCTVTIKTV